MGLVVCNQPQVWSVESMRFHGMNVLICEVITNKKRTKIIGVYLPTSTLENLPDLEETLTCFGDQYSIVLGEINANINQS